MNKGHGGVVFGSESAGDIRNVTVKNCEMDGTDRGIRFKTRRGRGGTIEHIAIEDVTMKDVLCPVSVNLFYRCGLTDAELKALSSIEPQEVNETTPAIRDISIRNVKADNVKAAAGYFCGLPEQPITKVYLENITVTMADCTNQYEPAMDMFHTRVKQTGFLQKFTNDVQIKSVSVLDHLGRELQQIVDF
jgi:polygalacturonase